MDICNRGGIVGEGLCALPKTGRRGRRPLQHLTTTYGGVSRSAEKPLKNCPLYHMSI